MPPNPPLDAGSAEAVAATAVKSAGQLNHPDQASSGAALGTIAVQVCYLAPGVQAVIDLEVPVDATVKQALQLSGIVQRYPEIDITTQQVGVYGKTRELDAGLSAHDRIEIYRPLTVDPKVARARRVAKTRKGGSVEGRKWARRVDMS